jgi:hypothetical protein
LKNLLDVAQDLDYGQNKVNSSKLKRDFGVNKQILADTFKIIPLFTLLESTAVLRDYFEVADQVFVTIRSQNFNWLYS